MNKIETVSATDQIRGKKWSTTTKLGLLVAVGLVFGIGFMVGRGDLRLSGRQGSANELDYSSVNQLFEVLKQDFDGPLNRDDALNGIKEGLVSATKDPYTEYLDPKEAKEFKDQLTGSFTGIGAELGTDENKNIVIVSPLSGYPAEKAGLKSKDVIAAVDGQNTSGMTVSAVVGKIRGPADSKVVLTIIRGSGNPFEVTIMRTKITVPSVESKIEGSVGYLKISQFSSDTAAMARVAAQDFKSKNVKAVVLDLRGNPGGYLNSAVEVSSLFLEKGKVIVQQKKGNQVQGKEYSSGDNILKGLPIIVLIDGGSASASEITAGALRDNGVATLLGTKSFGKGSVQRVETLPAGAELKVTVARWFTPAGKNIDKQGIEPDVKLEKSEDDTAAGKDTQKDRAYELLLQKL
ncbi:S41 family peptidase [Candidatus Saccharibacteria bacterium]|nr:S41 family peptidase [Candidatus Saccharibacteria bacterium]